MVAKYHQEFSFIRGIGAHVKKTVIRRKGFRPQWSDSAPTNGADRKLRNPLIPTIIPFIKKVCSGKDSFNTVIMGLKKKSEMF